MTRFLFCFLLFSLLIAGGCSGTNYGWYKAGASDAQINWDCRECFKKAEIRRNVDNYDTNRQYRMKMEDGRNGGYYDRYEMTAGIDIPIANRDHVDSFYDRPRSRRDYNIKNCMKDKGYRWVRK